MDTFLALTRFVHIASGILWIGLLYYLNFVQVPSFGRMDPAARANAIMVLVPRAMLWFRYAALATVLAGITWFIAYGSHVTWDIYMDTARFKSIAVGGTLGMIMFLNVWLIIWPLWRKVIAAVTATIIQKTPAPPDQPKWSRKALLASRTNVVLSVPLIFFMVAAANLPSLWT